MLRRWHITVRWLHVLLGVSMLWLLMLLGLRNRAICDRDVSKRR